MTWECSLKNPTQSAFNAFWVWGIPVSDIMAVTGHTTEKQCREYIGDNMKVTESRLLSHEVFKNPNPPINF